MKIDYNNDSYPPGWHFDPIQNQAVPPDWDEYFEWNKKRMKDVWLVQKKEKEGKEGSLG